MNHVDLRPPAPLPSKPPAWVGLLFGTGFGFVLGAARLHEYATIHNMLKLKEFDVFFLMGSAIATAFPLLWLLNKRGYVTRYGGPIRLTKSRIHRNHIVGSVIFGVGWAVAGTCPAPALVMLSSGGMLALLAVGGIFVGNMLRDWHSVAVTVGDGVEVSQEAAAMPESVCV